MLEPEDSTRMPHTDRKPAYRYAADLILDHIRTSRMVGGDPLTAGLLVLADELKKRGGGFYAGGLTPKQHRREMHRKDPSNPLYWTGKQKMKAERKRIAAEQAAIVSPPTVESVAAIPPPTVRKKRSGTTEPLPLTAREKKPARKTPVEAKSRVGIKRSRERVEGLMFIGQAGPETLVDPHSDPTSPPWQ
jgi:hypothetical protein